MRAIWNSPLWGPTVGELLALLLFVVAPVVVVVWVQIRSEPRDELGERRRLRRIRELAEEERRLQGLGIHSSGPSIHSRSTPPATGYPLNFRGSPLPPHRPDRSDYKRETSETHG